MIEIKFEGLDFFGRPIFKSLKTESRYGSTDILFNDYVTEQEVLKKITEKDLCYFGNSFGCEPMGDFITNIKIKRIQ